MAGRWDDYLEWFEAQLAAEGDVVDTAAVLRVLGAAHTLLERGDPERARAYLNTIPENLDRTDRQVDSSLLEKEQLLAIADGRLDVALQRARQGISSSVDLASAGSIADGLRDAATLAVDLGAPELAMSAAEAVETLPPAGHTRTLDSQLFRLRAMRRRRRATTRPRRTGSP